MHRIRLVIADDHTFYRQGVRAMLSGEPELEVIGEAATGEEAVAQPAEVFKRLGSGAHIACPAPQPQPLLNQGSRPLLLPLRDKAAPPTLERWTRSLCRPVPGGSK